jgi:hypothetical protein
LSNPTELKRALESQADVDTLVTMLTQLTAQLLEGDAIKSVDFKRAVYGIWGVCVDDYDHGAGLLSVINEVEIKRIMFQLLLTEGSEAIGDVLAEFLESHAVGSSTDFTTTILSYKPSYLMR